MTEVFQCSDPHDLQIFASRTCSSSKIPCSPGLQWWELELSMKNSYDFQVAQLRSAAASSKLHSEISQKAKPSVEGFWSPVFRSAFGGLHRELAWIWICVVPVWSLTTETMLPSAAVISDHSRWCCACRFACCAAMSWFRTSQLLYFWGPWGSVVDFASLALWISALLKARVNQLSGHNRNLPFLALLAAFGFQPTCTKRQAIRCRCSFDSCPCKRPKHIINISLEQRWNSINSIRSMSWIILVCFIQYLEKTSFVSPCGQLKHMLIHVSIWVSNWIRQFWMLWLSMDYWCWIFVFVPQLHCPRPV